MKKSILLLHFSLFFIIAIFLLLFFKLKPDNQLCTNLYDSGGYVAASRTLFPENSTSNFINFHTYDSPINRPYLWPLLIALMRLIGTNLGLNQYLTIYCFQIIIWTFIFTFIAPIFFTKLFHLSKKNYFIFSSQIIIFFSLIFLFWHELLFQIMADFPALCFLLIALLTCLHYFQITKKNRGGVWVYLYHTWSY